MQSAGVSSHLQSHVLALNLGNLRSVQVLSDFEQTQVHAFSLKSGVAGN